MGSRLHSALPVFAGLTPFGRPVTSCLLQQVRPLIGRAEQRCPKSRRESVTTAYSYHSTDLVLDWPLQAALFGLLFSYACYVERPRGWADSSLIEVSHPHYTYYIMLACIHEDHHLSCMLGLQVRDSPVHGRWAFTGLCRAA